ncbi:MAG: putative zinc-binding metallopeptidase [Lacipirellulaceae bacterium]
MDRFQCRCGATLFFESARCVACGCDVGWCDSCEAIVGLDVERRCTSGRCTAGPFALCANRRNFAVCNGLVTAGTGDSVASLCRWCRRTRQIPDVTDPSAVRRWVRLERAKRRLLFELTRLGLDDAILDGIPPLVFDFLADTPDRKVLTGHADGVVTVNIAEADSVHRERLRREMDEPHRTLIGHLRHEFAHYLWLRLVDGSRDAPAATLFGDAGAVVYADALAAYYEQGPPENWADSFISAYATAHPWEDFAETAAFYLDLRAVLHTLVAWGTVRHADEITDLLSTYIGAGVVINEVNRTMGLTDLVPEVLSQPVIDKLMFVHSLIDSVSPTCGLGEASLGAAPFLLD